MYAANKLQITPNNYIVKNNDHGKTTGGVTPCQWENCAVIVQPTKPPVLIPINPPTTTNIMLSY